MLREESKTLYLIKGGVMNEKLTFNYDERDTAYMVAVWTAWKKDKEYLPKDTCAHIQSQWIKGEISLLLYNLP